MTVSVTVRQAMRRAVDEVLPQTQCTRCGYADCSAYAEAIASEIASIDRCPPGGAQGIERLAAVTGSPIRRLDPDCGTEGPRQLAVIDEEWCIGCTLCLDACPVDAILGGPKAMHIVIDDHCTGCELCLPVCPVDCISLVPASGALTGWAAWSPAHATQAKVRYQWHLQRPDRKRGDQRVGPGAGEATEGSRHEAIASAIARARAERRP